MADLTTGQDVDIISALPTGDNTVGRVKLTDGTLTATVRDTGSSDSLNVAIVDGSGNQITSFGGGTEYTEDVAAAADPIGGATILVRKDAPAAITSTDGDNIAQRGTNYGAAYCQIVSSSGALIDSFGGSGGTAQADKSGFTEGTTTFTPVGGVFNDTISADPSEDQAAAARITVKRALHTNLRDSVGNEVSIAAVGDSQANLTGLVTATRNMVFDNTNLNWHRMRQAEHGTNSAGQGLHAAALIAEFDDTSPTSITENQFGNLRMSANRNAYTTIRDAAGNERGANVNASNQLSVSVDAALPTGSNAIGKLAANSGVDIGDVDVVSLTGSSIAHDDADSGNPHKIGFKAANALPTAVANNDRANGISDLFGRQLVAHVDPAMQVAKGVNYTTTQTGAVIWDPTSGKKIAITSIVIGSYGTTSGRLILWLGANGDSTYSAGTDQLVLAASFAPSATSKPGLVFTPASPIFCTTADHELHITTDANLSVDIAVNGYEWV